MKVRSVASCQDAVVDFPSHFGVRFDETVPAYMLLVFVCLVVFPQGGDKLVSTNSILCITISPRWLSELTLHHLWVKGVT